MFAIIQLITLALSWITPEVYRGLDAVNSILTGLENGLLFKKLATIPVVQHIFGGTRDLLSIGQGSIRDPSDYSQLTSLDICSSVVKVCVRSFLTIDPAPVCCLHDESMYLGGDEWYGSYIPKDAHSSRHASIGPILVFIIGLILFCVFDPLTWPSTENGSKTQASSDRPPSMHDNLPGSGLSQVWKDVQALSYSRGRTFSQFQRRANARRGPPVPKKSSSDGKTQPVLTHSPQPAQDVPSSPLPAIILTPARSEFVEPSKDAVPEANTPNGEELRSLSSDTPASPIKSQEETPPSPPVQDQSPPEADAVQQEVEVGRNADIMEDNQNSESDIFVSFSSEQSFDRPLSPALSLEHVQVPEEIFSTSTDDLASSGEIVDMASSWVETPELLSCSVEDNERPNEIADLIFSFPEPPVHPGDEEGDTSLEVEVGLNAGMSNWKEASESAVIVSLNEDDCLLLGPPAPLVTIVEEDVVEEVSHQKIIEDPFELVQAELALANEEARASPSLSTKSGSDQHSSSDKGDPSVDFDMSKLEAGSDLTDDEYEAMQREEMAIIDELWEEEMGQTKSKRNSYPGDTPKRPGPRPRQASVRSRPSSIIEVDSLEQVSSGSDASSRPGSILELDTIEKPSTDWFSKEIAPFELSNTSVDSLLLAQAQAAESILAPPRTHTPKLLPLETVQESPWSAKHVDALDRIAEEGKAILARRKERQRELQERIAILTSAAKTPAKPAPPVPPKDEPVSPTSSSSGTDELVPSPTLTSPTEIDGSTARSVFERRLPLPRSSFSRSLGPSPEPSSQAGGSIPAPSQIRQPLYTTLTNGRRNSLVREGDKPMTSHLPIPASWKNAEKSNEQKENLELLSQKSQVSRIPKFGATKLPVSNGFGGLGHRKINST